MSMIENFEAMLASGKDSALLRFSLGSEYMKINEPTKAAEHLRAAIAQDTNYSAAWKLLGKASAALGETEYAIDAYTKGIAAATAKGDKQAVKEMTVFLKRLRAHAKQDNASNQN